MTVKAASALLISLLILGACDRTAIPDKDALAFACGGDPASQQSMGQAVNRIREGQGKTILDTDDRLTQIAQSHACDIATRGRADVAGSDGSNVVDRARSVSYPTCGVAQLVGYGNTADEVISRWMALEPQRVELLAQETEDLGVGSARGHDGRLWWSLVLGNDCR